MLYPETRTIARATLVSVLAIALSLVSIAHADPCEPGWDAGAFVLPGLDRRVDAMASGTVDGEHRLFVGGTFSRAGGIDVRFISQWDGEAWLPLGAGIQGTIYAMEIYDDGSGPSLYVGGDFDEAGGQAVNNLARWDGERWHAVAPAAGGPDGLDDRVFALHVFDDGTGSQLYVGGEFSTAGGGPALNIARWDGAIWSPLGSGVGDASSVVGAIDHFDGGTGPELIVGGEFSLAGGVSASNMARWDGAQWRSLGAGVNDSVSALHVFDDGAGADLYAGGDFRVASGVLCDYVARWDGQEWTALTPGWETGPSHPVRAIASFDDGTGDALYMTGNIARVGTLEIGRVARFADGEWSGVGQGIALRTAGSGSDLLVHDDGSGPALVACGTFDLADDRPVGNIAFWRGDQWRPEQPNTHGFTERVSDLVRFDDGTGDSVYAGGDFRFAGQHLANGIARWVGGGWAALADDTFVGLDGRAIALEVFDDGSGPALCVAGDFRQAGREFVLNVARWTGERWEKLGPGLNGLVLDLEVYDDGTGPALYAVGDFLMSGATELNYLAKWDGTSWTAIPNDTGVGLGRTGNRLAVFDPGDGPRLYVGGDFLNVGSMSANRIASWDGQTWETLTGPMGEGVERTGSGGYRILAMATIAEGAEPGLYVGGQFNLAGGREVNRIARWDGTDWYPLATPLGTGIDDGRVRAIMSFDDDSGQALYVAGLFSVAGGVPANNIARWTGDAWQPLDGPAGQGLDGEVFALGAWIDDEVESLVAGGEDITVAGGVVSYGLARWSGCPGECLPDFDGDGALTLFDFLEFSNAFHRGEDRADIDADGSFTLFDFLAFSNAFDAGCP